MTCRALLLATAALVAGCEEDPAPSRLEVEPGLLGALADAQRPDGSWAADGGTAGGGDSSTTALSVLAFLDGGYTHRGDHRFAGVVAGGLRRLRTDLTEVGSFGLPDGAAGRRRDALATAALVVAYGSTASPALRPAAQRALDALVASGAAAAPAADAPFAALDAFGWAVHALGVARAVERAEAAAGRATLRADERALAPARAWLDDPATLARSEPFLVATRLQVRAAVGQGEADLRALVADLERLAAATPPADSRRDLSPRSAALACAASVRAGGRVAERWRRHGWAWLERATDATGRPLADLGPAAERTARVEAWAYASMAEPPCCVAYLAPFPGTAAADGSGSPGR